MKDDSCLPASSKVPSIVTIVLKESATWRARGRLSEPTFQEQIRRVQREELEPRGLTLVVRELRNGTTRFLIRNRQRVCEMIDCPHNRDGDGEG